MKIKLEVYRDDDMTQIHERSVCSSWDSAAIDFYAMMSHWEKDVARGIVNEDGTAPETDEEVDAVEGVGDEREHQPMEEDEVNGMYERALSDSQAYRAAH